MPETNLTALLALLEPKLKRAFTDAIRLITSEAQINLLLERLERNDITGAMEALSLDSAAFREFENAIAESYASGGDAGIGSLPRLKDPAGGRLVIRFNVRNQRAEQWLRNHSSNLITRILDDQREAIRITLEDGLQRGENPRRTALNIAGRVNRATQRREGGVVGVSAKQAEYVATARNELLSGDPDQLRNYLTRKRRDKRFDSIVKRAIQDEKPVPVESVSRAVGRYSDRLLLLRGETIARTETLGSLHTGRHHAFMQTVDTGAVQSNAVRKVWQNSGRANVRDSHQWVDGESVGLNERFSNGLLYPHEPGAPAAEIINCACDVEYRIDFLANVA